MATTHPAAAVGRGSAMRVVVWLLHVAAPMLALWLLIAQPELDLRWEDREAHFVLVLVTAVVGAILGMLISRAALRRDDARQFLVSLTFLISAGFLGLHALATPGVLLESANTGFAVATPVGLTLSGVTAALSAVEWSERGTAAIMRDRRWWLAVAWALLLAWAAISLAGFAPLDSPPDPASVTAGQRTLGIVGGLLYAGAALRYLALYRRRPAVVLLSTLTAFVLLAEALATMVFARGWQASWWLWHVLMALAFCFIAYSAHVQFRREGSSVGLFDSIGLQQTVADLRRDYAEALEAMVDAVRRREAGDERPVSPEAARLAERFGLTERQVAVLERAAEALGHEREQARRLGNLVAVGREASVIRAEDDLLARILSLATDAFRQDRLRLGLLRSGELSFPVAAPDGTVTDTSRPGTSLADTAPSAAADQALDTLELTTSPDGATLALPLTVKGRPAGVLEAHRPGSQFADADRALLASFASQASIALENARLYHQLDGLFRSYMSPAVATALLADPTQAGLGGEIAEVTVLMADLRGFTSFAERTSPDAVVAMLNTYYGAAVPVVLDAGGTVVQFVGDAMMAIFNAPVRQPDHALRAARAGLRLHEVIAAVAEGHDDWPRFRVGINTGPALVGNIGADQMRNFTAIGDTTNLAARLEGLAEPGQVVIGPGTRACLGDDAAVSERGSVTVKGKRDPVPVFVLDTLTTG
ncbi:adenylate/guanylate cyclase domain-containing protein [Haloechinothrix halophila]|uniref:adenylate/guanylate cyclase domain-containing protein n=1 Tax=Haloechinothrix halophila TaxID=1069073 RepID=UPI00041702FB|nr:adenylate/guanylate cyclase domain-containing protein [Haloechinothrix halophila]